MQAVIFGFGQGEGHPGKDADGYGAVAVEGGSSVKYLLLRSDEESSRTGESFANRLHRLRSGFTDEPQVIEPGDVQNFKFMLGKIAKSHAAVATRYDLPQLHE